jgi:UDP-N-acetylglucosamine pyrophosphorylase
MASQNHFSEFESKIRAAGLSAAAIDAFRHSYDTLLAGHTGMIPESSIQPVSDLPRLRSADFQSAVSQNSILRGVGSSGGSRNAEPSADWKSAIQQIGNPRYKGEASTLLNQTVIIKLNGGLGTGMGLERAKSLLPVKEGLTFLDFIVKQILDLRKRYSVQLRFLLMNSFSTSADTLAFLRRYPELGDPKSLELMQNQVPKVDAKTLRPIAWPQSPQLEWCPPGHGDLYPSLLGSGLLDKLLGEGIKYAFVSNSDNLGATLDLELLQFFAESNKPFLMEVAERTPSDKKGGHLARRGDTLLLRESAQCPESDSAAFQDIQKHRFFNTNSIWLRLDQLKKLLQAKGGFVPLPLIKNSKTVDPRDKNSSPVFQLETAMGAAIECFEGAGAIVVPRTRFAPVKTTSDLFALRSDAYIVTPNWGIELAPGSSQPPTIDLDSNYYKLVDQLDEKLTKGVPSLKDCRELIVRGPIAFNSGNIIEGKVSIINKVQETKSLPAGCYRDCEKLL